MASCAYVGPAPVTLAEYVTVGRGPDHPGREPAAQPARKGLQPTSRSAPSCSTALGPAVNSGAGLFLYGEPGNGKTTLAKRITSCFGQTILVPHAIVEDGQIIKVFDAAYHETVEGAAPMRC